MEPSERRLGNGARGADMLEYVVCDCKIASDPRDQKEKLANMPRGVPAPANWNLDIS